MNQDMLDLRSDEERQAEAAQQAADNVYLDDLRHILRQPEGVRVLDRILMDLGFCTQLFQKSADVYAATARHDMAVLLAGDIARASPSAYAEVTARHVLRHYQPRED